MTNNNPLKVKIFADGANLDEIRKLASNPNVKGFTTNPTLMRKAGIIDYEAFGREVLAAVPDFPVSLEVFADDLPSMLAQGLAIASWGKNVNVKVPVTNTKGEFTGSVIKELAKANVVLNITAIMTLQQVKDVAACLNPDITAIISVFAGRIADTGLDPIPLMVQCRDALKHLPKAELLWASPRELLNIFQADECGCKIVTVPHDILNKAAKMLGTDLTALSLDTVKMFAKDAAAAGFKL